MTIEERYKAIGQENEEEQVAEFARQMRAAIAAGKGTVAQVAAGLPQVEAKLAEVVDNVEFCRGMRRYLAAKQVVAEASNAS